MATGVILGHPGTAHAVEESRLVVGVGRVQQSNYVPILGWACLLDGNA
jgi:hypothetical protein